MDEHRLLEVTDPHQLRALAHPVRMQLLQLVRRHRPVTGARLAQLTGESTASVSYHLSILARHGFVEPDPTPGPTKRHKPWRTTYDAMRITGEATDTAPVDTVEGAVLGPLLARARADQDAYFAGTAQLPEQWADLATFQLSELVLTAEEFAELSARVESLLGEYRGHDAPPMPPDRARFTVSFVGVPTRPGDLP